MSVATSQFVPFHQAAIDKDEIDAVFGVLKSGWLTTGAVTKEFEQAFARYTGATHALAVNSCTSALHLALLACGIGEGDEVILPTITFASTGEVIQYCKARPVLVDSAKDRFHVDPGQVERAITPRTKAVIPVHYAGYPCDMDPILDIARRYGIRVIEDAAHSFPSSYQGRMIGTLGDITCFSFYATKTITTGEGGMITTENQALAERMRIMSLHGISRDAWKRYTAEGTWRYDILEVGYKYNLTDLQSAIGLAQLGKAEELRLRRAAIAKRYTEELSSMEAYQCPPEPNDASHAWHLYVLRVNPDSLRIGRDQVIEELKSRGIGTSVHFIPLHLHSLYQKRHGYEQGQFLEAERHFERAISLPLFPDMTAAQVDRVLEALRSIAGTYGKQTA